MCEVVLLFPPLPTRGSLVSHPSIARIHTAPYLLQIRGAVAQHLRHHPNAEILITGHSLGGALATLCFLDLQLTLGLGVGPKAVSFAPLYIFGSPRVGGQRSLGHFKNISYEKNCEGLVYC